MNGPPPRRLRRMSARLPYALRRGLAKLPDPEPTPAQLRDLRERLAPLLPRESQAPMPSRRVARSRVSGAPKVGRLRGTIAAALFPLAVAAGVRVADEYRHRVHPSAPPIQVEATPEPVAAPRGKTPAPAVREPDREAFPDDVDCVAEPLPARPTTTRAPTTTATPRPRVAAPSPSAVAETSAPEAPPPPRARGGEFEMLGRAVAALASDPAKALALTADLERAYPDGMLRQEREVVAIKALVKLGEVEHARARLEQFRSRYATSIHVSQLQRLVP